MIKLLAACALFAGTTCAVHAEVIDVFLLAGQSNMAGFVNTGYTHDTRDDNVRYFFHTEYDFNSVQTKSTAFTPLAPIETTGFYGPEIMLGRALIDGGLNPAIVKVSFGGTSLSTAWNSRASSGNAWWQNWKDATATALGQLTADGHTVNIRGFFWLQGESDAGNQTMADAYETHFTHLTADVASYLNGLGYGTDEMVYITALIHHPGGGMPHAPVVRTAQMNVMNALDRGAYFDTSDLERMPAHYHPFRGQPGIYGGLYPANLHFGESANNTIGMRFAETYFSVVPEPSSAMLVIGVGLLFAMRRYG